MQKLRNKNMGDVWGLHCHLVLAFVPKAIFPHQDNIQKGDFAEFWILMDYKNGIHPIL
jgi:hypothetical protein